MGCCTSDSKNNPVRIPKAQLHGGTFYSGDFRQQQIPTTELNPAIAMARLAHEQRIAKLHSMTMCLIKDDKGIKRYTNKKMMLKGTEGVVCTTAKRPLIDSDLLHQILENIFSRKFFCGLGYSSVKESLFFNVTDTTRIIYNIKNTIYFLQNPKVNPYHLIYTSSCPYCGTHLPNENDLKLEHLQQCRSGTKGYWGKHRLAVISEIYGVEEGMPIPYQAFVKKKGLGEALKTGEIVQWEMRPKKFMPLEYIDHLMEFSLDKVSQLATEEKHLWFCLQIESMKKKAGRGNDICSAEPIIILIEREFFLRDSFEQFKTTSDLDLRKEIKINFLSEISQDAGGLIRDWFSVLMEKLLDPELGLFVPSKTPQFSYIINEFSGSALVNHLEYFTFCGQVVAKAMFERIPLKVHFNYTLLKAMMGQPVETQDLEFFDNEVFKTISFIKTTTINANDYLGNLSVLKKDKWSNKEFVVPLCDKGETTQITEENKEYFINIFSKHILIDSIANQLEHFLQGFYSLLPEKLFKVFDLDEFELFLCGKHEIDILDWKENSVYEGSYTKDHSVIANFWKVIEEMNCEHQDKMLQYCTGSSRVPAEGFKGLRSSNGKLRPFTISPITYDKITSPFPKAHTCFNKIELPNYPNIEIMREMLVLVLSSPASFEFSIE